MTAPRIIPPEEARRLVGMFEDRSMDDPEAYGYRDLAHTAAVLGEQRAAVLTVLHRWLTDPECAGSIHPGAAHQLTTILELPDA